MIRILITKHEKQYRGFCVSGHAGFAESGSDIVCAAVSALSIHTVNGIEAYTQTAVEYTSEDGLLTVNFPGELTTEAQVLMDAYVSSLKQTIQQYGRQYIHLEIREV